jgi:hypothetical protein
LLDGPYAALLGDALRAHTALLTSLHGKWASQFWHDPAVLPHALTGHPSARKLSLAVNETACRKHMGLRLGLHSVRSWSQINSQ